MLLTSKLLNEKIASCVRELWNVELPSDASVDFTRNYDHGDLTSTAAMRLAGVLRRPPARSAAELATAVLELIRGDERLSPLVADAVPMGGFVNFTLSNRFWREFVAKVSSERRAFGRSPSRGVKAQVEYVSANPTGPLTVAHGRQAAVGDTLCRILEAAGFEVQREYYLNDTGNQMRILGLSVYCRLMESRGRKVEFPDNCYQGDYIRDIAALAYEKMGDEILEMAQDEAVLRLGRFAGDYILGWIKEDLADFRVGLDNYFSQQAMEESGLVERILERYRQSGKLYEKDGAVWLRSSEHGDSEDRVVVKSDGSYTYRTPDIAYHVDKFDRGFDWLIVLLGPDHHAHTITMKAALKALGYPSESLRHIIIQHCTLYRGGEPLKMSTRRATYITLREVMDAVGTDAARFFFLNRSSDSHLDFDLELAMKQAPDNPVFYLQYASARCASILAKAHDDGLITDDEFVEGCFVPTQDVLEGMDYEEVRLSRALGRYSMVVEKAALQTDQMRLINYLMEAVEFFHNYYQRRRVICDNRDESRSRLAVVSAFRQVLANGLDLLGISAPVKM
ncbi:MAG: arginine--tRNA ligase [Planctomycetota bacterium]